jgi:hypothetical protein
MRTALDCDVIELAIELANCALFETLDELLPSGKVKWTVPKLEGMALDVLSDLIEKVDGIRPSKMEVRETANAITERS